MMNNMKTENIEALLLQYAENELDDAARAEVEALLAAHPEYLRMLEEYDPTFRLPAPPAPEFPDKGTLLKTIPMPRWIVRSLSAAAVILLLCLAIPTALRHLHRTDGNEFTAQNGGERQTQPAAKPEPAQPAATAMQPANTIPAKGNDAVTTAPATTGTNLMADAGVQPSAIATAPENAEAADPAATPLPDAATTDDSVVIVQIDIYTDCLVSITPEEEPSEKTPEQHGRLYRIVKGIANWLAPEEKGGVMVEKLLARTENVIKAYDNVSNLFN
ncbi:MAG: hypothetical protein IKO59_04670 [Bacteroidales bacterium]|nr:hypothetical protein [Bacteroidales bacterium]